MTDTNPVPWPFHIDDPVRAVHYALERECPWGRPESCPREHEALHAVNAYRTWLAVHSPAEQGDALREQYAAALDRVRIWHGDDGAWGFAETPALTEAVLAVRDRRMEQLVAGRETWRAKAEEIERDRDRLLTQLNGITAERDSLGREADRLRRDWVEQRDRAERAEVEEAEQESSPLRSE
ncbi:hypothetical protein [Streptomyces cucumeris]|uniref:hypothetical protein n=1 Tax=Streptomyces cucumeris TaxID=2962890 RepID=UPI0020C8CC17|nr:hypothetical protein [Streptomyces sp. NEAU-Y11]MCP9209529.1 hypothetical protein [Streptomyces sp. NEAU-Y11]